MYKRQNRNAGNRTHQGQGNRNRNNNNRNRNNNNRNRNNNNRNRNGNRHYNHGAWNRGGWGWGSGWGWGAGLLTAGLLGSALFAPGWWPYNSGVETQFTDYVNSGNDDAAYDLLSQQYDELADQLQTAQADNNAQLSNDITDRLDALDERLNALQGYRSEDASAQAPAMTGDQPYSSNNQYSQDITPMQDSAPMMDMSNGKQLEASEVY